MKKALKEVKKIKNIHGEALTLHIVDIYNKHDVGEEITATERVMIGLVYSEFITDDNDNDYEMALYVASKKAEVLREILEIDHMELLEKVESYL